MKTMYKVYKSIKEEANSIDNFIEQVIIPKLFEIRKEILQEEYAIYSNILGKDVVNSYCYTLVKNELNAYGEESITYELFQFIHNNEIKVKTKSILDNKNYFDILHDRKISFISSKPNIKVVELNINKDIPLLDKLSLRGIDSYIKNYIKIKYPGTFDINELDTLIFIFGKKDTINIFYKVIFYFDEEEFDLIKNKLHEINESYGIGYISSEEEIEL